MKYVRLEKTDGSRNEIDRDAAKKLLSRNYTEKVCSFDEMLEMVNEYPCMTCTLIVSED